MGFFDDQEEEKKPVNPVVADYLLKKASDPSLYDKYSSQFGDEALKKAQADADSRKSGLGWAQFAAGVGDAIAGRSPSQSAETFNKIRKNIDDETVGQFEKRKSAALQDISAKKSLDGIDVNSEKSKVVQNTIKRLWGDKFSDEEIAKVTADDADLVYKPMELKSKLEQTAAAQEMAHQDRLLKNEVYRESLDKKKAESVDKLVREMRNDFDPDKGRAGNFGQISAKVQGADRLKTLIDSYKDGNLPPAQMEELSLGLANMLAGSSGASRAQVEALVPHTLFGKTQDAAQWLLNEPRGAGQQKFVEQMAHTIDRERETAVNQLNAIRASRLPVHETLRRTDPERYNSMLQSYGLDPKNIKDGKYVPPPSGDMVTIQTPDGRTGTIPRENLQKALSRGAKVVE